MVIEFLWECWVILAKLAPWFLLGAFIAGLLHGLLPRGFIHRRLRGPAGVVKAVLLGVPLPLCSCGVVPAGIGLRKDGASRGASVGFLISTPQTGVDSILVSASFLGWPFAIFKVAAAAVTGLLGGWITDWLVPETNGASQGNGPAGCSSAEPLGGSRSWKEMADHALEIIDSIRFWLIVGIVASAAIGTLIPPHWLASLSRWGTLGASLFALGISVPLYVCATASVPIGAALVQAGFPTGATLVFLMAGPATNVATVGAIYREFGGRTLAIYLATIILGSLGLAQVFDWLIAPGYIPDAVGTGHEHLAWWSHAAAAALAGLLIWQTVGDLRRRWRRHVPEAGTPVTTIGVDGMQCQACAQRLEKALQAAEGVESVQVRLEPGEAIVAGTADRERLASVIAQAGFQPRPDTSESTPA